MLRINDVDFEVEITKKRIRNIYLKVLGNKIIVSCPYYVPQYEVYNFIDSKKKWIYKVYKYNEERPKNRYIYNGSDVFYLFGKEYKFIRSIGKTKVTVGEDTIFFTYKDDSEDGIKALYKQLDKLLLSKAKLYLDKYRYMLLDYGYNQEPLLNARIMSSRWGVCFTRNNKITVSSYLIHYPEICLEYIMVHELTHFIIPNHSKRFYEIIANNMPNYKQANQYIK